MLMLPGWAEQCLPEAAQVRDCLQYDVMQVRQVSYLYSCSIEVAISLVFASQRRWKPL